MAVKVSQLTQISSPSDSDYLYVSQPLGEGYVSRRLSFADLVSRLRADITPGGPIRAVAVTGALSHGEFWALTEPGGSLSAIFNCRSIVCTAESPRYAQPLYTADGVNSYVLKVLGDDDVDLYAVDYLPDSSSSLDCPYMVNGGSGTEADPYTYVKQRRLNSKSSAKLPEYKWIKNGYQYIFLGADKQRWLNFSSWNSQGGYNPDFWAKSATASPPYHIISVAGPFGKTYQLFKVTGDWTPLFDM